jgi:biopolymer transport protein ExbD
VAVFSGCSREPALRAACDKGDADACDVLRARYAYGDGVPKDRARSAEYARRVQELCAVPDAAAAACAEPLGAVPLDLPRASVGTNDVETVLRVVVTADGRTLVNDVAVADDDALRAAVRPTSTSIPPPRAVVVADKDVTHGRVIHLLDELKTAGITRISFAVTPAPPIPVPRDRK